MDSDIPDRNDGSPTLEYKAERRSVGTLKNRRNMGTLALPGRMPALKKMRDRYKVSQEQEQKTAAQEPESSRQTAEITRENPRSTGSL